jgi:NAD binding domain of 6-phosphogluconate dehydrogenase
MSTTTAQPAIGFIGLGDQGLPMATAIAEAGYPLHVWARRPSSLAALGTIAHGRADEGMHLLVRRRPREGALGVCDVTVERGDRRIDQSSHDGPPVAPTTCSAHPAPHVAAS